MENKIDDSGDLRKFFISIPNLIDDTQMSIYAFRLYVHLKRVAGDNGKCWQGTRTLAESCHMSIGKISQSKQELNELGLIKIASKRDEESNNEYHEITIIDIWDANMKRYCSPDEHPPRSQGEKPRSSGEQWCSQDERKKNPVKNNPLRKTIEDILSSWEKYFPDKPQPRPTTKSLQAKVKTRLEDEHFKEVWREAMKRASESPTLQAESWFDLNFFLRNDQNYLKCYNRWMAWKDRKENGRQNGKPRETTAERAARIARELEEEG